MNWILLKFVRWSYIGRKYYQDKTRQDKMASMALIGRDIFDFCSQTFFIGSHQTWQMCSSKCSEKFLKKCCNFLECSEIQNGRFANWPRHVLLIFQENSIQTLQKCSSKDPIFVLYISVENYKNFFQLNRHIGSP